MLLVRRLKKKPSVAPKKKRAASLLLRNLLVLTRSPLLQRLLKLCVRLLRLPLHLLLQQTLASATSLVVRTNHVPTITIVAVVVAMASVKTLHIVPRSKRKRLLHALLHVLPTKKAMASVVVVAARPS